MGQNGPRADALGGSVHGNHDGVTWGATDSLGRVGLDVASSEQTPLLDNENTTDTRRPPIWEGEADFEGVVWWKKPSVTWLLPLFFLFALALGGIVVPKTQLILSLVCREYLIERSSKDPTYILAPFVLGGNNPQCTEDGVKAEVSALVAEFLLALTLTTGILSAIVAPKLGSLSDQYGRTKILFLSSLGAFFTEIITILLATYPDQIHYRWLILGAIFDGLCGSFTTAMAISYAYASDCTAPPKRAEAFGYFHACLFAGIALGPLLTAILFKFTDSLLPIFYIALGIHSFFMLSLLFVIPESLSAKRQLLARERLAAARDERSGPEPTWLDSIRSMFDPLKILYPTGPGTSSKLRANLILLASIDTIMFGVAMGSVGVVLLYVNVQFAWKTDDTSFFIALVNTFRVSALVILLPTLNYIFRTRPAKQRQRESGITTAEPNSGSDLLDLYSIRFAIFMEFVGYLGYAIARSGTGFAIAGVLTAFGGIGSPTLQSSLTKHVPHDMVGSLLGATGFLHALSRIVCPLLFNMIYAQTVGTYTQAVFVVISACFAVAFLLSWLLTPHIYLNAIDKTDDDAASVTRTNLHPEFLDEEIAGI